MKMESLNNMKLENGMLVTLTNEKEYAVISTVILNNINYVYLVENEKNDNMIFCVEEIENNRIKLTEVEDLALRQILLKEFIHQYQQEKA